MVFVFQQLTSIPAAALGPRTVVLTGVRLSKRSLKMYSYFYSSYFRLVKFRILFLGPFVQQGPMARFPLDALCAIWVVSRRRRLPMLYL